MASERILEQKKAVVEENRIIRRLLDPFLDDVYNLIFLCHNT